MSITSLGLLGSFAGTAVPQRAADAEKTQQSSTEHRRAALAAEKAESAAGIGQTEEDSEASERDADGRRPWEMEAHEKSSASEESADSASVSRSKDPTGESGGKLDLVG